MGDESRGKGLAVGDDKGKARRRTRKGLAVPVDSGEGGGGGGDDEGIVHSRRRR